MKIKVEEKKIFNIKIGETDLGDFKIASEWEGFIKISNIKYGVIFLSSDQMPGFDFIKFHFPEKDYYMIKASPSVIDLIRKENINA